MCSTLTVLTYGGNLFHNKTVDGKNDPSYTFKQPNIGLKSKFVFCAFEGDKGGVTKL